jgi:hypothetical protein
MLALIGWVAVLWSTVATCYVALIHLKKLRKQGKPLLFWTASLIIPGIAGWLVDVLFMNFVVGTVAYLELPHELTFSSRVQRHYLANPTRKFTAWWAARLNEIDDSPHIHGPR